MMMKGLAHRLSQGESRGCIGSLPKLALRVYVSGFLGSPPLPPYSGARSGERQGAMPSAELHPLMGCAKRG